MLLCCLAPVSHADLLWYPFPVQEWLRPLDTASPRVSRDYVPLLRAKRKWRICVSFPHIKDAYWLAVNFGVAQEAKRLNVKMQLYEAGGYDRINTQIQQIKACAKDADGVIIGAISYTGLDPLVARLKTQGLPVIDVINGMGSPQIAARSLVSFEEMGFKAGEFIVKRHKGSDAPVKIAWFPGPQGAGWVSAGNKGFHKALHGTPVTIVATKYGDTGRVAQGQLIREVLASGQDIDYIVGTAVSAEAAIPILRRAHLTESIQIVSYYFTPGVYLGIRQGRILAAPTDAAVIQGRIALDQMVRILDGKTYYKRVGPVIQVIDRRNIDSFERSHSLAPKGFRITFTVN